MTKHSTQAAGDRVQRPKRTATVEHTRKRTQVACERCRKRKIKCLLSLSEAGCETCNNAGEKCVVNRVGSKECTFEPSSSDRDEYPIGRDQPSIAHHTMAGHVDPRHYQHGLLTPSASSRQGSVNSVPSTSHSSPYRSNLADQYGYGPLPGLPAGTLLGPHVGVNTTYHTAHRSLGAAMLDTGCGIGSLASQPNMFQEYSPMHSIEAMRGARFVPRTGYVPTTGPSVSSIRHPGRSSRVGSNTNRSQESATQARITAGMPALATPSRTQSQSRRSYTAQTTPSDSLVTSPGLFPSSHDSFSSASSSMHGQQSPTASATSSYTPAIEEETLNMAPYANMTTLHLQGTQHPGSATYVSEYPRRPSYAFAPYAIPAATPAAPAHAESNRMSTLQNSSLGYSPTTASYQYQPYYASSGNRVLTQGSLNNAMAYIPYNYHGLGPQQARPRHSHQHHNNQDSAGDRQYPLHGHHAADSAAPRQHSNSRAGQTIGMQMSNVQEEV